MSIPSQITKRLSHRLLYCLLHRLLACLLLLFNHLHDICNWFSCRSGMAGGSRDSWLVVNSWFVFTLTLTLILSRSWDFYCICGRYLGNRILRWRGSFLLLLDCDSLLYRLHFRNSCFRLLLGSNCRSFNGNWNFSGLCICHWH